MKEGRGCGRMGVADAAEGTEPGGRNRVAGVVLRSAATGLEMHG